MIIKCAECEEDYCMECSEAIEWKRFCSKKCENFKNEIGIPITITVGW